MKLVAANVLELAAQEGVGLNKLAHLSEISRPTMHFLLSSRSSVGVDTIAKIRRSWEAPVAVTCSPGWRVQEQAIGPAEQLLLERTPSEPLGIPGPGS
jgi:hypothetical protein